MRSPLPLPLLSLLLIVFSLTTGEFVIAGILPEVADELGVSIPSAGLLVTAYALGMIVGGPLVTVLTAGVARRPLVAGLVTVSIAANLGSAVAPSHPVLLAARFAAGLVVATFFALAITTAVSMAREGRQASTVAKLTLGMNLGIVLGTPLGTLVGQGLGWRAPFVAIALLSAVALLLALLTLPAGPAASPPTPPAAPARRASPLRELRVFANRDLQLALALTALGNVGAVAVFVYISPLLTDVSGFSTGTVPALLLLYGAGATAGNFLGGWLADRALLPSLAGLLAALAAVLALFRVADGTRPAAAVLTFALGVLAFAIIPGMQTRVMATATAAPTLAVAVNASGFQLAAAFAGWLGGRVVSDGPGLRALPLVGAALTLAGLAVALHALRRDRRARAEVAAHA
ncbi:MFS transporter [Streptomyces sp. SBT349]|uniref:MFS transporter n=1 Tax=Streptomyces sp. SBT349 TaxID=1580539 RepID=UPI00066DC355|nr:MFS transporter [Streptomyces sp. SBT349]